MKKTIALLLLTALCLCILTSCNMGNGLINELFGISPDISLDIDPVPEYFTTEVHLCDCGEPMYENHQCFVPVPDPEYITTEVHLCDCGEPMYENHQCFLPIPPEQTEPAIESSPDAYEFPDGFKINGEDMEDWDAVEVAKKFVYDQTNLRLVQGEFEDTDGFTMYMAVDPEYLILGFDVTEYTVVDSEAGTYNGDHFTISLDLGELSQGGQTYPIPMQYSFGKTPDGCICILAERQLGEDTVLSMVLDYRGDTHGGHRVKNEISGSKILKSGWKAEFVIPWYVLIAHLCESHGVQSLEQLGLTPEKLYATLSVTYVDVSKDGSVNKIYRTENERFLFLPQQLQTNWLETVVVTD